MLPASIRPRCSNGRGAIERQQTFYLSAQLAAGSQTRHQPYPRGQPFHPMTQGKYRALPPFAENPHPARELLAAGSTRRAAGRVRLLLGHPALPRKRGNPTPPLSTSATRPKHSFHCQASYLGQPHDRPRHDVFVPRRPPQNVIPCCFLPSLNGDGGHPSTHRTSTHAVNSVFCASCLIHGAAWLGRR